MELKLQAMNRKESPEMHPVEFAPVETENAPMIDPNMSMFEKFIKFAGPGFLISIACLDPGNLSGDIAIAQQTRFELYWVLVMAHVMAYIYQSIALTVGSFQSLSSDDKQ